MSVVAVGARADWTQRVTDVAHGVSLSAVPTSGQLELRHIASATGARAWWTGAAWTPTRTVLPTTIVGDASTYQFTVPDLPGDVLEYDGMIDNDPTTRGVVPVTIVPVPSAVSRTMRRLTS